MAVLYSSWLCSVLPNDHTHLVNRVIAEHDHSAIKKMNKHTIILIIICCLCHSSLWMIPLTFRTNLSPTNSEPVWLNGHSGKWGICYLANIQDEHLAVRFKTYMKRQHRQFFLLAITIQPIPRLHIPRFKEYASDT